MNSRAGKVDQCIQSPVYERPASVIKRGEMEKRISRLLLGN
jgi:hypothetical protein